MIGKVLITGGNGLIGNYLVRKFLEKGIDVAVLTRTKPGDDTVRSYLWDVEKSHIENGALEGVNHIIHLAGENVGAKRWSESRKKLLIDSRVKSAKLLLKKIKEENKIIESFISSSAIGYYGAITSDRIFNESDPPADDFMGRLCSLWEKAADEFSETGARTVQLRTGLVMTSNGGVLSRMMKPIKMGLGAALGSGKQYQPWIHIEDLCEMYVMAVTNKSIRGGYNAVSPQHITNIELTKEIARVLNKPLILPKVPSSFIRLLYGEMSDIILKGSRVSAQKIIDVGFQFNYNEVSAALQDLLLDHKEQS